MKKLSVIVRWVLTAIGAYVVIVYVIIGLTSHAFNKTGPHQDLMFSDLIDAIDAGGVESLTIEGENYLGKFASGYKNGVHFESHGPKLSEDQLKRLQGVGTRIIYVPVTQDPFWKVALVWHLPIFLVGGVFGFLIGRKKAPSNNS